MQNRFETQFKQYILKINLFVGEKRKSTKGIEQHQVDISIRRVFGSKFWKKKKKHETGDAKGDKKKENKEKTQNNWNQMENGTKKKEEREKHKENKVKKKKGDERMKKCKEDKKQRR